MTLRLQWLCNVNYRKCLAGALAFSLRGAKQRAVACKLLFDSLQENVRSSHGHLNVADTNSHTLDLRTLVLTSSEQKSYRKQHTHSPSVLSERITLVNRRHRGHKGAVSGRRLLGQRRAETAQPLPQPLLGQPHTACNRQRYCLCLSLHSLTRLRPTVASLAAISLFLRLPPPVPCCSPVFRSYVSDAVLWSGRYAARSSRSWWEREWVAGSLHQRKR